MWSHYTGLFCPILRNPPINATTHVDLNASGSNPLIKANPQKWPLVNPFHQTYLIPWRPPPAFSSCTSATHLFLWVMVWVIVSSIEIDLLLIKLFSPNELTWPRDNNSSLAPCHHHHHLLVNYFVCHLIHQSSCVVVMSAPIKRATPRPDPYHVD